MRTALLTFHGSHNFGSVFQAYGLKRRIEGFGADCDIVNFRPRAQLDKYSLVPRMYGIGTIAKSLAKLPHFRQLSKSHEKYENFISEYLVSAPEFSTMSCFSDFPEYDVYITGSDQVWGYSIPEFVKSDEDIRPAYYFSFAEGKKISYASSTGEATAAQLAPYASLMKNYSSLSVREEKSVSVIEELTGRGVSCCLDPTFLIPRGEYRELANLCHPELFPRDYVLLYSLQGMRIHREWMNLANSISRRLGIPVLSVSPFCTRKSRFVEPIYDAGPLDILGLFANASLVLTDTFHGTLFSMHFSKDFVVFEPGRDDPRIKDVLRRVGLLERIAHDPDYGLELAGIPVDYTASDALRSREIAQSEEYLRLALGVQS